MIKILKSLGYMVNQEQKLYEKTYANFKFQRLLNLYNISQIIKKEDDFWALTNLRNIQEIIDTIDFSPLSSIEIGYEWIVLFNKK